MDAPQVRIVCPGIEGWKTEVFVNDKPPKWVKSVTWQANADSFATATLEIVNVRVDVEAGETILSLVDLGNDASDALILEAAERVKARQAERENAISA